MNAHDISKPTFILISLANEKAATPNTESAEHAERKN